MQKINTTGQMRKFLASVMLDIKEGNIDVHQASQITKMAGQINESFYAEAKVSKMKLEAGEQADKFGAMKIGEEETE